MTTVCSRSDSSCHGRNPFVGASYTFSKEILPPTCVSSAIKVLLTGAICLLGMRFQVFLDGSAQSALVYIRLPARPTLKSLSSDWLDRMERFKDQMNKY